MAAVLSVAINSSQIRTKAVLLKGGLAFRLLTRMLLFIYFFFSNEAVSAKTMDLFLTTKLQLIIGILILWVLLITLEMRINVSNRLYNKEKNKQKISVNREKNLATFQSYSRLCKICRLLSHARQGKKCRLILSSVTNLPVIHKTELKIEVVFRHGWVINCKYW